MRMQVLPAVVVAALAWTLTACSGPASSQDPGSGSEPSGSGSTGGSVTIGWSQPFFSYNDATTDGNDTANAVIKYMMGLGFAYYDDELELVPNADFGSYEKTSDDPLIVEYTIGDHTAWSDGTPVDAADLLLEWAAGSGQLNTQGSVAGDGVYFDAPPAGLELVTRTPEISADGTTLTVTYDEPFADWEQQIRGTGMPAHVTVAQALGIEDPTEAKRALIDAVTDRDEEKLAKIADFWNNGYDFKQMPNDDTLYLSHGPYVLTDLQRNESATLEKNPAYAGELRGNLDQITVLWNEDPSAQWQQLQAGEIDAFQPPATADLIQDAHSDSRIEVSVVDDAIYEHFDLTFDNGGPFDPRTYGGDQQTALAVRQAFTAAYPRQEIVSRLIEPIDPDAEVRDSYLLAPGAPGYEQMVRQNGTSEYAEADPARARRLLREAGVTTPIRVRMLYADENERRSQEFELVRSTLEEVGFEVIDGKNLDWGSKLGDGTYDAVFFGWQATSTAVTEATATYATDGLNNLNGYSNQTVDEAIDELHRTIDPQEQLDLQVQIETELVADAYGLTLFQFPGATYVDPQRISGIETIPLSPTIFYRFWDWSVPPQ